jgi:hypothetical protein
MPLLTRRRSPDARECWQIFYGDVRVGSIAKRIGIPCGQAPWGCPRRGCRQALRRTVDSTPASRFSFRRLSEVRSLTKPF